MVSIFLVDPMHDSFGAPYILWITLYVFCMNVGEELLKGYYGATDLQESAGFWVLIGIHLSHVILGLLFVLMLPS